MMPVRTAQATQPDLILELREQCLDLLSLPLGMRKGWRVGFGRHQVVRGGSNLYSFAPSEAAGLEHENPRYCPRGILSAEHFAVRGQKICEHFAVRAPKAPPNV